MKPFIGILSQNSQLILSTNQNGSLLDHGIWIHQIQHYCILFHMYGATQSLFSQVSNLLPPPPIGISK